MLIDRKCSNCGHTVIDKIENQQEYQQEYITCPNCKQQTLKKLPASCNFKITGYSYSNSYSGK